MHVPGTGGTFGSKVTTLPAMVHTPAALGTTANENVRPGVALAERVYVDCGAQGLHGDVEVKVTDALATSNCCWILGAGA